MSINQNNNMEGKPQFVAAIDVGTTKIVTLLGKRNENRKLEIVGFTRSDSRGIRRGEVLNPEEASNVVRDTIIDLQRRTGVIFSEVFVGIAGQHIRIVKSRNYINRASYDDSITAADIEKLNRDAGNIALDEGKEIIHILPQSYIVDNETDIFNPIGMLGKRLEANYNIVVGNIDSIKRIKKCIHQTGLTIKEFILEPLASSDAVLYDEEREAGVALVDIGGGTTDLAVFHDNVLRHSAVFPYGGSVVTRDIKEACGLSEEVAEEVKLQFGVALSDAAEENKVIVIPSKIKGREPKEVSIRNLAHIIQARMEEIIDGIMFEVENSGYAGKLGCGIVITGGGAMLRHLKELFHFRTGMDVRISNPGEHLTGDSENINEPCYATGVGLLMKGFEYADKHPDGMAGVKIVSDLPPNAEMVTPDTKPIPTPNKKIAHELVGEKNKKPKPDKPFDLSGIIKKFKDGVTNYFDAANPQSQMEEEREPEKSITF